MKNLSNINDISKMITDKSESMLGLAKEIYDANILLAEHDKNSELIDEKIDLLRFAIQKEIVEEKCPETGKSKHSNDIARKSELIIREQDHEPLKMMKSDRLDHIETNKKLLALIEFKRKQFLIAEKMMMFLAGQ